MKYVRPPSFSPIGIIRGIRGLWDYRDLLVTLSVHRIKVRYKQSALGILWALLQPLALMAIYTLIFSTVARMPSEGGAYPVLVYSALLPWTLFATAVTNSSSSMVSHSNLITKVYFPREIIPITYIIAAIFDFLIGSVVLFAFMIYYKVQITANIVYAIPALAICIVFSMSLALILSALQVRFRDIGLAMPLIMQLGMFATPVVYQLNLVPRRFWWWYTLNPMVGSVETFRRAVVQGTGPEPRSLMLAAVISVLLVPLAYLWFKNREATMADII